MNPLLTKIVVVAAGAAVAIAGRLLPVGDDVAGMLTGAGCLLVGLAFPELGKRKSGGAP